LDLPAGSYNLNWTDTKNAGVTESELNGHPGGWIGITSPAYFEDIALKVARVN
jgi:subtilase family serine protease